MQGAGVALALETDRATRSPPDKRTVWIEGADGAEEAVELLDRQEIRNVRRESQNALAQVERYFVC
ncbi:MAG TPA: hypothetical protein VD995_33865 [Azospirillum sp.]|nr:hypothetical protein [Azospirillum sp.]